MRRLFLLCALAGCATDVTTGQAHELVAHGARLVDVRSRAEFAERHPPAAINIPVEELKKRTAELEPRDRPIVVYCHTGVRAGIAVEMLRNAGFKAVYNVGTLGHWLQESQDPPVTFR